MSPQTAPPGQSPEDIRQWIHVDDFTPGCFDNSFISLADPKLSAPPGAADALATWCCGAFQQGQGLGPLPALTMAAGAQPLPGACTSAFVTGFAVNPGLDSVQDELIIIIECDDGTTHYVTGTSVVVGGAINAIFGITGSPQPGIFGSPYPTWTRMTPDGTGTPPPVLVFPASILDGSSPGGHLYVYPALLAPSSFGVQDLIVSSSSVTGQVICYGSRVLVLVSVPYDWPAGGGIGTNENINYTDPPLSAEYGDQSDVIAAEAPWGYGAWGTVSVGELMLIKKNGGGLIIYGDIDAITSAIEMPGVQSVGDFVGKAAPGPLGLVYCSEQRGAWVWNGSNVAQKISQNLRDSFYDATTATGMEGNNYGFCVAHWQNWILFSNNYLFDMDNTSWWQLYPGDGNGSVEVVGHTMWWWNEGRFGNQMYGAPLKFLSGAVDNAWYYLFDSEVPAPHWQWQSLPIHVVPNADRSIDVREVFVRLSDPTNSGHATATVTVNGEVLGTVPAGDITNEPTSFRFNSGVSGVQDIIVRINGDNAVSGSSPVLHSIDIGWAERAHLASVN